MSVLIFALLSAGVLIQAYRDLSRPDAWDYWKDLYATPSTTSSVADVDLDGRRRTALVLRGKIGPAAATWFREKVDEAHLRPGDVVLLSSPGGDLGQSVIMGELIRAKGLTPPSAPLMLPARSGADPVPVPACSFMRAARCDTTLAARGSASIASRPAGPAVAIPSQTPSG